MTELLIAYASKYGSTEEIAQRIGATLRDTGLDADVLPAEEVNGLKAYQAVIVGSAVYAGSWRQEVTALLEQQAAALATLPLWLFSSGPTGEGDPSVLMKGYRYPEALAPLIQRLQPRDIAFFHGVLDVQKMNFAERLLIKAMKAPLGDFRDWPSIEAWAMSIAEALRQPA